MRSRERSAKIRRNNKSVSSCSPAGAVTGTMVHFSNAVEKSRSGGYPVLVDPLFRIWCRRRDSNFRVSCCSFRLSKIPLSTEYNNVAPLSTPLINSTAPAQCCLLSLRADTNVHSGSGLGHRANRLIKLRTLILVRLRARALVLVDLHDHGIE